MHKTVIIAAIVATLAGCGTTSNDELNMLPHASADTSPLCTQLPWFCEAPQPGVYEAHTFADLMRAPRVSDDDPSFDCIFDGNRICGPLNPQGAQPGCYNDHGALVAPWPCHVVIDATGSADVYGGAR